MMISVIIPAFNEEANIAKTLQAIEHQTLPKDRFEVIVVDNGSTDSTVAIASRFKTSFSLQVVTKTGVKISAVRNYGASFAKGDILAFLDADCLTSPTWLEKSLSIADENAIWGAHYLVQQDATWVGKVWFDYQATEQEGPASFIPGSNLFIYRDAFQKIGGFGESLETSEDVELSLRARSHGMQTLAYPALAVFHEGTPRTLDHFYRQNRWHGKHVLRMFIANLPSTKNLGLVAMSFYTLLLLCAAIVVPVVAIPQHHWFLAVLPLLLLLLPSVALSLQKTLAAQRLQDAPALCALYMTYFFARAAALMYRPPRSHR
jgi:glycosyltransferase involved in cell wall biosynthesis